MGQNEIGIEDEKNFSLVITDGFASPNLQTGKYFTISINNPFELPWVLDKPFPAPIQGKLTSKTNKIKEVFKKIFKF